MSADGNATRMYFTRCVRCDGWKETSEIAYHGGKHLGCICHICLQAIRDEDQQELRTRLQLRRTK